MDGTELKEQVVKSLLDQGFLIEGNRISLPHELTKENLRAIHLEAVQHKINIRKKSLFKHESRLLLRMARGDEVQPEQITPRLIQVKSGSDDELLFRYACLHWSIPVSSGYGRRLRFLVIDEANGKLIGVIGLGDPVFSLGDRDKWIGWTRSVCSRKLHYVMDAFALGAVPPYSNLLCGKLVAMLVASNEIRQAFLSKYSGKESLIAQKKLEASLALITTTSALGRSSIYNRLKFEDRPLYISVGFTRGSGEFHFTNGLYDALVEFANEHCKATAKQPKWGVGFRNRREVLKKCLPQLGLSADWLYHGIQREIFVIPLAQNTCEFLRSTDSELISHNLPVDDIFSFFRERWLLPRAATNDAYRNWEPEEWRLW